MSIKFTILGRPVLQKNNLFIRRSKSGKSFIGHSKKFSDARDQIMKDAYQQFLDQEFSDPIDYLCEVHFTFYCPKQWEGDLDNYPAAYLDSLQGSKKKDGTKEYQVLVNDKLVRRMVAEKIILGDSRYHGEPRAEIEIREYDISDT